MAKAPIRAGPSIRSPVQGPVPLLNGDDVIKAGSDSIPVGPSARAVVIRSLLAASLAAFLVMALWTTQYLTNDDATMAAFASGDYTGNPSPRLVFVGSVAGLALAVLHTLAQPVPWFALTLSASYVGAIGCLIAIAYVRRDQLRTRGNFALTVLIAVFLPVLLLRLSFTGAAILVSVAGVVVLALATRSKTHGRTLTWLGSLCIGFGSIVRFESFEGVIAVFVPFIVLTLIRLGRRRSLLAAGILITTLGVSALVDHVVYSSTQWSSYLDYNDLRGQLSGNASFAPPSRTLRSQRLPARSTNRLDS